MPRKMTLAGATLALLLLPLTTMAQKRYIDIEKRLTAEQLRATGLDTLTPAQLELLNRFLREEAVDTASAGKPNGSGPDRRSYIGLDDKPISSHLKGAVSGWDPGTVFELENGQQWKVLKGSMKLRKPLNAPEVLVVPGVAGRWFLQVDEDLPKARVYRID